MKKKVLVIILFCLFFKSFGQLKPQIGINIPSLSSPPLGRDFETRNGFSIGATYMMGNQFYMEPGLLYSTYGFEIYRTLDPEDFTIVDSRSLEIPFMVGGRFMPKENSFNVRAFTGPKMTWAFAEDIDSDLIIDERKTILWGWVVGYGIDYKMFFMEANYEFGLTDYFETSQILQRDSKKNMFSIKVGVNLFK